MKWLIVFEFFEVKHIFSLAICFHFNPTKWLLQKNKAVIKGQLPSTSSSFSSISICITFFSPQLPYCLIAWLHAVISVIIKISCGKTKYLASSTLLPARRTQHTATCLASQAAFQGNWWCNWLANHGNWWSAIDGAQPDGDLNWKNNVWESTPLNILLIWNAKPWIVTLFFKNRFFDVF